MNALAGFVGGLQQGYTFVEGIKSRQKDEERRDREEGRRDREEARRDNDVAFQEEERNRTRANWTQEDAYKADIEALNKGFFPPEPKTTPAPALGIAAPAAPEDKQPSAGLAPAPAPAPAPAAAMPPGPAPAMPAPSAASVAAPSTPAGLPKAAPAAAAAPAAPAAQPAGMPVQPNQLTNMGQSMDYLIRRAQIDLAHNKIDGTGLVNLYKLRDSVEKEGINESIDLLAKGDIAGAERRFNQGGQMQGWKVQSAVDGIFEHGGAKLPTRIVTVQGPDGTTRTINTAQYQVQGQKIDQLVTQAQKAVEMTDRREDAAASRRIQQQNADTQEQYRRDQADNMREQRRIQAAGGVSPIWTKDDDSFLKDQYTAKDEMSGAKTFDGEGVQFAKQVALARSRFNGGDSTSATAYALAADARLKLQAGGDPTKLRELRQQALQQLASPKPEPAGPATPQPAGAGVARQAPAPAGPAPQKAPPPAAPPPSPARVENGVADVRNDPVIASLRKSLSQIDGSDPRNVDTMMSLGTALNTRIEQLQVSHGAGTKLITE
jgi:hypothetical protein